MDGFFKSLDKIKNSVEEGWNLEQKFTELPSVGNQYNKVVLASIYAFNAYKSSFYLEVIFANMVLFIEKGSLNLEQQKF